MSIPENLQPQYRDLLQVVTTMNCGLLASDLEGVILWANPTLLRWLGYGYEEILGQPSTAMGVAEHAEAHAAEIAAIAAGDVRARLVVLRRSDSTTFPALVIPQRLMDEDESVIGSFSIVVDLGTVQTAKRIGVPEQETNLVQALEDIAAGLQKINRPPTFPTMPIPLPLDDPGLAEVSRREAEVLELLVQGDRVPVIAEQLFISEHTVRNHLKSMFRKTGTSSQAELIQFVRRLQRAGNK